jgi:hypothetical protein
MCDNTELAARVKRVGCQLETFANQRRLGGSKAFAMLSGKVQYCTVLYLDFLQSNLGVRRSSSCTKKQLAKIGVVATIGSSTPKLEPHKRRRQAPQSASFVA